MKPTFFASSSKFRHWLETHHDRTSELWVGFYKRQSGRPSITWPEAVDAALCFGWIDGLRKGIDDTRYTIRFSPRKPRSIWSAVNVKRANALATRGLMHPAGLRAFQARDQKRSGIYAYEQRKTATLDAASARRFRGNKKAWAFFQAQAPWYRRTASWWVISAKQEETRVKRLATLIDDSAHARTIARLTRRSKAP